VKCSSLVAVRRTRTSVLLAALALIFAGAESAQSGENAASPASELSWSPVPGTYEQDLLRRHDNPLYMPSRRSIGRRELLAAKRLDAERAWEVLEEFISIAAGKKRAVRYDDADRMLEFLNRIDLAMARSMEVGGEAYSLVTALAGIRVWLMEEWKTAASDDPEVAALLSRQKGRNERGLLSPANRFLAQIGIEDGPIQDFERVPALLCEDESTIRTVIAKIDAKQRSDFARRVPLVLEDIRKRPDEFEGIEPKVAVLRKSLASMGD
jgi:hypothetical protein